MNSIIFAHLILILVIFYYYLSESSFDLHYFNKSLASTAVILIGLSFALSGLCYFWDFADTKLLYRKFIGIVGFGTGLLHAYISLLFYINKMEYSGSNFDLYNKWNFYGFDVSNVYAFIFGLIALIIFAFMTGISNRYATVELGGQRWRIFLRTGYIALFLILLHFSIKNYTNWLLWFESGNLWPPMNLILVIFIFLVFFLRAALEIDINRKKKKSL